MRKRKKETKPSPKTPLKTTPATFWQQHKFALLALAAILLLTTFLYLPSLQNGFTNWDDSVYVTQNVMITQLSGDHLWQMLTQPVAGNYHPLTMLSLALDYQLGGLNATVFHRTNMLLHLLNTLLVFVFVYLLTKRKWLVAGLTALWFGIHPMHVESVAWVAERKDVLYSCFFLTGLVAYLQFLKTEKWAWLGGTFVLFLLSLLAKPAAVVFPVVLLLIDYFWDRPFSKKILVNKIPFFLLSLLFGWLTLQAQVDFMAVKTLKNFDIIDKFLFACHNLGSYIFKMLAPVHLSTFYPFPDAAKSLPLLFKIAPLFVIALGALLWWSLKKTKIVAFGLLFYGVTIALVLQFLIVGEALIADRYTYLPYIGLFFIISCGIANFFKKMEGNAFLKYALLALVGIYTIWWGFLASERIKIWKNDVTIWTDVIEKYPSVPISYNNRGLYFYQNQEFKKAMDDYNNAIQYDPNYLEAYINRGILYRKTSKNGKALADFNQALQLKPNEVRARNNRGNVYFSMGEYDKAITDYTKTLAIKADHYTAYGNRGAVYLQIGNYAEALSDFNKTLRLNPNQGTVYRNRAILYKNQGENAKALQDALRAQQLGARIEPSFLNSLK